MAAIASCFLAVGPATAQTVIDPRWGVLAELAERDFVTNTGVLMSFRWQIPNRTLRRYVPGENSGLDFELDLATGQIVELYRGARNIYRVDRNHVLADGSYWSREGNRLSKISDIEYKYKYGRGKLRPLVPGEKAADRLARAIQAGKTRAANPQMLAAASASIAMPVPPIATRLDPSPQSIQLPATLSLGPRFALVIGNGEYSTSLGSLKNPPNDARLVADQLRASGFQVELVIDADQRSMKQAISRLGERMASGGRGSTGLFYFAGHGMQSRGVNYLIPTNAAIKREADVDLEAVSADTVLLQMEEADAGTNIIILDACRNTPVLRSFRSGTRGLAQMEAPNGSFISYSTAPGSVAADGAGDFSPFASALAQQLRNKAQPIEITFRNVRREVLKLTEGQQTPWDSSSLVETFMFNPG